MNKNNGYTTEQFISYARLVHGDLYLYNNVEYKRSDIHIIITCPHHGDFKRRPKDHLYGLGCPKCAKEQRKSQKTQDFIKKSNKIHKYKYKYTHTRYVNNKSYVKIICPIHGLFEQRARSHLDGTGCRACFYEEVAQKFSLSLDEFIERARCVHGDKYDYSKVDYINNKTDVIIICPKHGEFTQSPHGHLSGNGCKKCYGSISKKASKWLDQFKNIKREEYIKIGEKTYIVDGINLKNGIVYEFWGDFWHGNPKIYDPNDINLVTKTTFGDLYNKTIKKIKDLKEAGFTVVSIWECEWDIE